MGLGGDITIILVHAAGAAYLLLLLLHNCSLCMYEAREKGIIAKRTREKAGASNCHAGGVLRQKLKS